MDRISGVWPCLPSSLYTAAYMRRPYPAAGGRPKAEKYAHACVGRPRPGRTGTRASVGRICRRRDPFRRTARHPASRTLRPGRSSGGKSSPLMPPPPAAARPLKRWWRWSSTAAGGGREEEARGAAASSRRVRIQTRPAASRWFTWTNKWYLKEVGGELGSFVEARSRKVVGGAYARLGGSGARKRGEGYQLSLRSNRASFPLSKLSVSFSLAYLKI
jgi:hypothetical protein